MQTAQPVALRAPQHLPSLDGLRALAVLLVVPHNLRLELAPHNAASHLLDSVLDRGWIGVDLFFVLSGFLITRILLQSRLSSNYYSGFFMRRGLRIWPLYFLTLLIVLAILPGIGGLPPHDSQYDLYFWLFLSNLFQPLPPGGPDLPHFWSLALEEQFYLAWPFVVRLLPAKRLLQLCWWIAAICLGIRWAMLTNNASPEVVYMRTWCRIDAMAIGAAVAAWLAWTEGHHQITRHTRSMWLMPMLCIGVGGLLTGGFRQFDFSTQSVGYTLLDVGFAGLVLCLYAADMGLASSHMRWLRGIKIRRIGRYSYGMYVLHIPVGSFIMTPVARHFGWLSHASALVQYSYVLVGLSLSYLAATLSYHGIEKHALKLKTRFAAQPIT